jgi:hypothetical protein
LAGSQGKVWRRQGLFFRIGDDVEIVTTCKRISTQLERKKRVKDLLIQYMENPSKESYLRLRRMLLDNNDYNPYSADLYKISELIQRNMFQQALNKIIQSMINLMLSPRAHMFASIAYMKLGQERECQKAKNLYKACLSGILSTGDGSKEKPYLVTSVSDEHDVLSAMEKEFVSQSVTKEQKGKRYDVFELTDGTRLYFDITDCFNKIDEKLFGKKGSAKRKHWWQFRKHKRKH